MLVEYDSSGDEDSAPANPANPANVGNNTALMQAAPEVSNLSLVRQSEADVSGPVVGPHNPFENTRKRKVLTGETQEEELNDAAFKRQQNNFAMLGYARNLDDTGFVGNLDKARENDGRDLMDMRLGNKEIRQAKRRRQKKGDSSVLDGDNAYKGPWAKYDENTSSSDSDGEEEDAPEPETAAPAQESEESDSEPRIVDIGETSEFCGSNEVDYLGRTYMHVPQDLGVKLNDARDKNEQWHIPTKVVKSWQAHKSGVTRVRLFPNSNHLLLSSGQDGKIHLYDMYHDRELLRVFTGHSQPIRDIAFNASGNQFLSCSVDKLVKLWDTETGKCINKWTIQATPTCVLFNPLLPDFFLVGCADHRILQYDINRVEVQRDYFHHLGAIRSLTFLPVEDNKEQEQGEETNQRFVSTSTDKSIRVWEWNKDAPVKFISDPGQRATASVAVSPFTGKHVLAQQVDDKIVVYNTTDRFKLNKKKRFGGFAAGNTATGVTFSPDGRFVLSGSAAGEVVIWDWKQKSLITKLNSHNKKACTQVLPHLHENKLVTAGLDSMIHLWG